MARGKSGRIVIEVDPVLKLELYAALARTNSTLKDWFVEAAARFCDDQAQPDLFGSAQTPKASAKDAAAGTAETMTEKWL